MDFLTNFLFTHTPLAYLTQSIWRDEAFSYFMSIPPVAEIIQNTATDFNPPVYYLLLHFWIYLTGKSDIGLRFLSILFHAGSVYVSYLIARRLYSMRFAFFVAIFTLINPMLLYYAFEVRMYSLYALLTLLTLYFFSSGNRRWYVVSALLGLYTHSFFLLVPFSLTVFAFISNPKTIRKQLYMLFPFIGYLPWMYILADQFKRSQESWIYPVDDRLIRSVLGNLFTNFEGTPDEFWPLTAVLSAIILAFLVLSFRKKKGAALLFFLPVILSLVPVLGFSMYARPIFVNRYFIYIAVFEVFGITLGIWNIQNKRLRTAVAVFWIIIVLSINFVMPPFKKKTDYHALFQEINSRAAREDFVYTKTPISYFESRYYYTYPESVFVYNPEHMHIPDYIGISVVFQNIERDEYPPAPSHTYLIHEDGTYDLVVLQ